MQNLQQHFSSQTWSPPPILPILLISFLSLLVSIDCFASSAGLKCVECNPTVCGPKPNNCPNGYVLDRCDCCHICGKPEGEFCGGKFGRCGDQLICEMSETALFGMCIRKQPPYNYITKSEKEARDEREQSLPQPPPQISFKNEKTDQMETIPSVPDEYNLLIEDTRSYAFTNYDSESVVPPPLTTKEEQRENSAAKQSLELQTMMDDPSSVKSNKQPEKRSKKDAKCYPRCTADLCRDNPRQLCSATRDLEIMELVEKRNCRDACATTVCRACEVRLEPHKSCHSCPQGLNDLSCVKEFGRCVKKVLANGKQLKDFEHNDLELSCAIPSCYDV